MRIAIFIAGLSMILASVVIAVCLLAFSLTASDYVDIAKRDEIRREQWQLAVQNKCAPKYLEGKR